MVKFFAIMMAWYALFVGVHTYQAKETKPPELTEVQKLKIQNLTQRIELAQLRAQAAQREFDTARETITTLLQSLQIEGYTLNIETLSYVQVQKDK